MNECPSRIYNDDVEFICKIRGREAIEAEFGELKNDDIVLTNERKAHILKRRGKHDYELIMKYMEVTLKEYDAMYDDSDKTRQGICYIKKINELKYCGIMVSLSLQKETRANSNITSIIFNQENYERYTRKRKLIDKK